jgi:DNA repair photolyase
MPDEGRDGIAGRGAGSNLPGRFETRPVEAFDDGWDTLAEPLPPLETTLTPEKTRTLISRNDSPDVPFDRSINPYKGCEHGCVYCFARPTHSYLGLSPGLDFESRIFSKPDAPDLLRRELAKKGYRPEPIAIGANTDAYQPVERRERLTRRILEVLVEYRHPFSIITKSNLVLRDLDLIAPMARERMASVFVSITTLDRELARRMEPRAPTPQRRLDAIRGLSEAGVPVGVLASPIIPGLNDAEIEKILEAAAGAGASMANYILLRLPHELKEIFAAWLDGHYPLRAKKVLNLIRETRGGKLNEAEFGSRMRGVGEYAEMLARRYRAACARLGLQNRTVEFDLTRFTPPRIGPADAGPDAPLQGTLFS